VLSRHDFLPFGEEWSGAPARETRLFTGKERDAETGLDYFGARYYRADLGRFTTADPIGVTPKRLMDPQRLNRYSYVQNRPLVCVDPDGRYEAWIHEVVSATLLRMAGVSQQNASEIVPFTGSQESGADHWKNKAVMPWNWVNGVGASLHFPSKGQLADDLAGLRGNIDAGQSQRAGWSMHAVQDGLGAHSAFTGASVFGGLGHAVQSLLSVFGLADNPDRVVGDAKFIFMANCLYASITGDRDAELTADQINELIEAVRTRAGELGKEIVVKQSGTGKK